jgi:hypothetical protein
MAQCSAAWHIQARGDVHDAKYHAGASSLVRRHRTSVRKAEPPFVKTNVEIASIGVGLQTLYFFPDRLLVWDRRGVGAVGYANLQISVHPTRFIEEDAVPGDAQIVDRTWKYVNKRGGPDKRFKDNRELPVCLYEELALKSPTGLHEVVQISKCGPGRRFSDAVHQLARRTAPESGTPRP